MEHAITQENLITEQVNTEPKKKERIIAFDFLRIIAALAVVMSHSAIATDVSFSDGVIFDSLSRFAVPVFLMISGALMLDEKKTLTTKDTFKKIFFGGIMLLIWNVIYAGFYHILIPIKDNQKIALSSVVKGIVLGNYHFWYMYLLLGLYLITPILRLFVKKENMKYLLYFVFLAIIFQFLPRIIDICLNKVLPTSLDGTFYAFIDSFYINGFFGYITYYILGWIIVNLEIKKCFRYIMYAIGFISMLIMILGTELIFKKGKSIGLFNNLMIFNFCYSTFVFAFFFYLFKKIKLNQFLQNLILKLSSLTFGVYLIHDLIKEILNVFIFKQLLVNNMIHSLVIWFITVVLSFLICYIISLIPL
ncbi:MAG: acyltransferase family protein [Clostridia bacterium]|nr:acyltransferase family protein [Clostridia bacterium]